MNPFDLLKSDHEKVSRILHQLSAVPENERTRRENLFQQLMTELEVHTSIEEKFFYPALRQKKETETLGEEAVHEHNRVKKLLKHLNQMSKIAPDWNSKLQELRQNIEHHVHEEEEEMFPKASHLLTHEQLENLGKKMQQEKERALVAK